MAAVQWNRDNQCADVPVVDGALWRGVAFGLPPSLAVWGLLIGCLVR